MSVWQVFSARQRAQNARVFVLISSGGGATPGQGQSDRCAPHENGSGELLMIFPVSIKESVFRYRCGAHRCRRRRARARPRRVRVDGRRGEFA